MAIASSSPIEIIKTVVNKFSFTDYFQVLVSGEEVEQGKPAPDVFLRTSEFLKVKPKFCLVLEDAPNGIRAAKAAGMRAIAVSNNPYYTKENFTEADEYVTSLEKIKRIQKLRKTGRNIKLIHPVGGKCSIIHK